MKKYTLNLGGVETTVQLSDEDASRFAQYVTPAGDADVKSAPAPQNKARAAATKEA